MNLLLRIRQAQLRIADARNGDRTQQRRATAGAGRERPGASASTSWANSIVQTLRQWRLRLIPGRRLLGRNRLRLGAGVQMSRGVVLDARRGPIEIGSLAWLGPRVIILGGDSKQTECRPGAGCGVQIGPGACIEADALILPGVSIGAEAIVSAATVVAHDVPAQAVVAGPRAWIIGTRDRPSGCIQFTVPPPAERA